MPSPVLFNGSFFVRKDVMVCNSNIIRNTTTLVVLTGLAYVDVSGVYFPLTLIRSHLIIIGYIAGDFIWMLWWYLSFVNYLLQRCADGEGGPFSLNIS